MPIQAPPRPSSVLASVLAAAGIVLTVASCSHVTPLGPDPAATLPQPRHLGSPIILQAMRSQPAEPAGGCPADWVALPVPGSLCYRKLGTPVTITSAAVSPVFTYHPTSPPGQSAQPALYGIKVAVLAPDVAAVTAVITQAYHSRGAVAVNVAGRTWAAPQVIKPFPGRQFEIAFLGRNRAMQLYRLLVPPG